MLWNIAAHVEWIIPDSDGVTCVLLEVELVVNGQLQPLIFDFRRP